MMCPSRGQAEDGERNRQGVGHTARSQIDERAGANAYG
jgi:hypothetical protein